MIRFNNKLVRVNGSLAEYTTPPEPEGTVTLLGKTYNTITIGNQTWLLECFQHDDGNGSITIKQPSANGYNFGDVYYYTGNAAVRVANLVSGWHLPTDEEWNTLINYVGTSNAMNDLCADYGWNSQYSNTTGFTILPYGYLNRTGGDPQFPGKMVSLWTSTSTGSSMYKYQFEVGSTQYRITDGVNSICNPFRLIKNT